MKNQKSSSGDMSGVHEYLKPLRGQEVTTSKIIRRKGQEPKIIKYKKIV